MKDADRQGAMAPKTAKGRVLVAMSGGVDSSVTAYLLQQQGYECIGATMKLYDNPTVGANAKTCCSLDDIHEAAVVAHQLGMRHYVFNYQEEFAREVIDRFSASYLAGITPNPCIDCNRYMKFDHLLERALDLGCDYIATGHYARIAAPGEWSDGVPGGTGANSAQRFGLLKGPGCEERPELRAVLAHAASAGAYAVAAGRYDEGGRAQDCRSGGPADGDEAREPGHLLRARR